MAQAFRCNGALFLNAFYYNIIKFNKKSLQERFYTGNNEEDAEIRQAVDELLEVAKYASHFLFFS